MADRPDDRERSEPSEGTGGAEEQAWQDLVGRLRSDPDSAMFAIPETSAEDSDRRPDEPAEESRRFNDFDPLGVHRPPVNNFPEHSTDAGFTDPGMGKHAHGPRDYSLAEDADDEEFEPPMPTPLSAVQPALVLVWTGAAGAPIALLFCALFWRTVPAVVITALILAFLAGVGYLIYRLPANRKRSDGDGAEV
ncbi:hypothetical protein ODZ83_04910 [Acaricomes phytoseiuli]|uniref:hypothetical protein n=1 Tax=Acaricomes phytoseiuli TaxID=291968 RepID=UPI00037EA975|nr:hypothetical protein [Acaricomes phytoseiuli]MCW1249531.1 hypothetical protein [Acaricomes phytoseiuli]